MGENSRLLMKGDARSLDCSSDKHVRVWGLGLGGWSVRFL